MDDVRNYLGDGVYAEMSSGMIKLTTNSGRHDNDPRHYIYLDPDVFDELIQFAIEHDWLRRQRRAVIAAIDKK